MIEFLADYGLFLLKAITIVAAIVVIIGVAASVGRKATHEGLEVESLNKKYKALAQTLRNAVLKKGALKKESKEEKRRQRRRRKTINRGVAVSSSTSKAT